MITILGLILLKIQKISEKINKTPTRIKLVQKTPLSSVTKPFTKKSFSEKKKLICRKMIPTPAEPIVINLGPVDGVCPKEYQITYAHLLSIYYFDSEP